ncbi:hypothetical protein LF1_45760 [Rubripirellula obstinata]|uniref:DUF559 domain-containing protein n=1 Tax=Rubripirellula obstinata TaxID=406547 RepID=A0A5B1CPW4_9BACT|nr:endonuclease domain-containing protein [Rubripirellula obstinata]KAA1262015.1 hypothetical protein LF1_45760 [Rubripirellula obstinata]
MDKRHPISDARDLRRRQTEAESLLWSVLRAKQVCRLKFRRQHPEPPYIIDFACLAEKLAVEIDGGYHDNVYDKDQARERFLIDRGWRIKRFTNEDVRSDVESVATAIARYLGRVYSFQKRQAGTSSVLDRQIAKKDRDKR